MSELKEIFKSEGVYLLCFVIISSLDFATGVLNALLKREFKSQKMRDGLGKYFTYFAICVLGCICEYVFEKSIAHWSVVIIITIETCSILENFDKLTGLKLFSLFKTKFLNDIPELMEDNDDDN